MSPAIVLAVVLAASWQTAAAAQHEVEEGIKAGVFYYLTKPYKREMLMGIVRSAILHGESLHAMSAQLVKNISVLGLMKHGTFQFRTLEEANILATFIAQCCPVPTSASLGLSELMVNAIEHGNLGITYAEKSSLVKGGTWQNRWPTNVELYESEWARFKAA